MGTGKEKSRKIFYLPVLVLLLALVPGASALGVTVSPDRIGEGDQVLIAITGLSDNSTFSLGIEGTFAVSPGGEFSFETRDLVLPFALQEGALSATLRNTETNVLTVQKGDTEVRRVGSSKDGVFTTSETGSIPAGTYELISFEGTAAPGASSIVASLTLQGKKSGPADADITFVVAGISDGSVTVTVTVDGTDVLSRTIVLEKPVTTTTTTAPYSGGGGGGGGGGGWSGISITSAATTSTATPTAVPATTVLTPAPETPAGTGQETTAATGPATIAAGKTSPAPTRSPVAPVIAALSVCITAFAISHKRR